VETRTDDEPLRFGRYSQAPSIDLPLDEPEEQRLRSLSIRYDELVAILEEEEQEEPAAELDQIETEIALLQDKKRSWSDEEKARSGAVVFLDPKGRPQIVRGLVKPNGPGTDGIAAPSTSKRTRTDGYADSVLLDLSAHRSAALRELLARDPNTALLALLHALVDRLFYRGPTCTSLGVVAQETRLAPASRSVDDSPAAQAFRARHAAWAERLPQQANCWEWLLQRDADERLALLAHCVGMTVNTLDRQATPGSVAALAAALRLDMREWWQASRANLLDRLTKDQILAAVSEGVSQQAAWRLAGLKKDRIAKEAEKLLSENRWLPGPLRATALAAEAVAAQ
jgi:ParB family chromosome partitioning protein